MKRTNEMIASLGLPIQQVDLEHPMHTQLDAIIRSGIDQRAVFRRLDVSEAIIRRFGKELERLTPAQRVSTNSMSTVPGEWRWRGVPIRVKDALPDDCVGIICTTPWTATFRGEDRAAIAAEKRG
jgi:hypothetical protein